MREKRRREGQVAAISWELNHKYPVKDFLPAAKHVPITLTHFYFHFHTPFPRCFHISHKGQAKACCKEETFHKGKLSKNSLLFRMGQYWVYRREGWASCQTKKFKTINPEIHSASEQHQVQPHVGVNCNNIVSIWQTNIWQKPNWPITSTGNGLTKY